MHSKFNFRSSVSVIKSRLLYLLTLLTPKRDRIVMLSFPAWDDNTVAIYNTLPENMRVVWIVGKNDVIPPYVKLRAHDRNVCKNGIQSLYYLVSSKVLFITHGNPYYKTPPNQLIINLWHGFGFKSIGTLIGQDGIPSTCCIATSEFSRPLIAKEMNLDANCVICTGYPRNDTMVNACANMAQIRQQLNFSGFAKIFIWMPTYRATAMGSCKTDGIDYDNPFNLEGFDQDRFQAFLSKNKLLCLFRPHPMAIKKEIKESVSFRVIHDKWLRENGLSLYALLGICDFLVSDVSSVITDFLIINKPVIHAMSDFTEFGNSRAWLLDPPEDYMVGPMTVNQNECEKAITDIINGVDAWNDKRKELCQLFFDGNADNKSAQRVIEIISNYERNITSSR